ncbi:TNF receptor-associated factor 2-like isoform X3 [Gadus macrocephalus]|uniref:TNF receptor-associated factor 2-like isoform X3 n=1 Tax=Gadus macrocephalus TaxID=80720 RepID=UPI0028CB1625|nr:TNF receptor-associated factor 2-like isoform X3 [Gadus macrocephalus]
MAAQEPSPTSSLEGNKPGFPKKILANHLEDKHLCNSCQKILRRPLQAQCGHRFCSFCFNKTVSSGPQKCSACIREDLFEEPTSILKLGGAFPDNAARREIEALTAVCPNEGCTWTGIIKEYEAGHEGDCEFQVILCPSCKELMRANEKERHNERECPERTLNCKYCKEPFLLKNIKVEKEKVHEHESACSYEHLNMLLHFIMGIKVSLESLQPQSLDVASHRLQELHQSLRHLEHKMNQLGGGGVLGAVGGVGGGGGGAPAAPVLGACALAPASAPALATTSFTPLPSAVGAALELQLHSEKTKVVELGRRCQQLELKVDTFENIVCVLNREVERSVTTMETYNSQHRLDQDKIEILSNKVRQLERTVGLRDLSIVEMEGKMREMAAATFDGIFVWKISDFTKKRQDAVAGRAPAMFSPAYYTSKYGYKMCLRIYLNGDGTGRSTHLSLFFVVMRGHSDALLKWPFNQKVTLMLLDQNNREHIIDAFRPDVSSSSFQRPVSDMNIASGCPLFCPLLKLDSKNSYIRDDTVFIKAIVDLTGL